MNKLLLAMAVTASLFPAIAFAQDAQENPQFVEPKEAPASETKANEITILKINCYTNDRDCSGRAYFKNNSGGYQSISYFYNNGSGGQWNFVLPPGQDHWVNARFNDTYAWAAGNSGVPAGASRSYVYVCCQ